MSKFYVANVMKYSHLTLILFLRKIKEETLFQNLKIFKFNLTDAHIRINFLNTNKGRNVRKTIY